MKDKIQEHLNSYNLDIRLSNNGRWIDQKCTIDILSLIADCIIQFVGNDKTKEFTTKDIWFSEYSVNNVQSIFVKPDPTSQSRNEYDKFFGQPLKLLGYSKVLNEVKVGNQNVYTINNYEILNYISIRESNALEFLDLYITKVLTDSNLICVFNEFFNKQDVNAYANVRTNYIRFTKEHTAINGDLECGRIFTKLLNNLAFKRHKHGTIRGHLSNEIITKADILYNRKNWRDENSGKPKDISRTDYSNGMQQDLMAEYKIQKAKRKLREFNNKYRGSASEFFENGKYEPLATQIHHIFPVNEFPSIADYLENLIVLTPNEHFLKAHPNNNTKYIKKDYQYLFLVCKAAHIKENLISSTQEKIYVFSDYIIVLNTGFKTTDFDYVAENDFNQIISMIDERMGVLDS